ncbi:hypothetical protein [Methanobrevibacter sp.]|uniref:hypothetical protein n=1 Tax=Methanobrevibacter sp. TaxID=66852 RepID=UPI0026E10859|nr:hypothetical protein [Methanobrevibacter sp.]MDO5861075.1 hypothetical protein [Methanobrevibacter sp.]
MENKNVPVIKKVDLPDEFGHNAYNTIVDFIQKTRCLDYEWGLLFDYVTGEILKCVKGKEDKVRLDSAGGEFEGKHISSIHNHPDHVLSPPSYKNFNIFLRIHEDYELVGGREGLWILKAKGVHENLIKKVREASFVYYIFTLSQCNDSKRSIGENNECEDSLYGGMLSRFINDKNINGIQLTKKEYGSMNNGSEIDVFEFEHFKRISNPDDLKLVRDFVKNPELKVNKNGITEFFAKMNIEINADELADAIQRHSEEFF